MVAPELGNLVTFLGVTFVATLGLIITSMFISGKERNPTPQKLEPFESGQVPLGEGRARFIMQYYPYLLMFVVFDVVAMFLFSWSLALRALTFEATVLVILFILILLVPLSYALRVSARRELW